MFKIKNIGFFINYPFLLKLNSRKNKSLAVIYPSVLYIMNQQFDLTDFYVFEKTH
jgi:hypothetical protein